MEKYLKPAAVAAVTVLVLVKLGYVGAGANTPAMLKP